MRERHRHLELVATGTDDYVVGSSSPVSRKGILESKIDLLIARIESSEDEVEALKAEGKGPGDGWTPALREAFEKQDFEGFLKEIPEAGAECFYPSEDAMTWDDLDLKAQQLRLSEEAERDTSFTGGAHEADSD
jgi:hypothetical protein